MHSTTVRSRLFILISFSLFCLLFVGCAAREQAVPERSYNGISVGESWQTIQSGQDERKFLLYVPDVYDGTTPVPLVLNFHGRGSNPSAQLAYSDFITYVHSEDSRPYWISGVEDSLAGWVDKNGCAENPSIEIVTDAVDRLRWGGCRDGAEIVFYRIAGGGHTWPGSSIVLTSPWSGKTSKDITATQLIWAFFSAHPLP
jgi:poly(3-hydroxybutyrate) depolymerase